MVSAGKVISSVADATRLHAAEPAAGLSGGLTIGVTRLVAGYYLTELLSRFRRHSPAVKVQVTEETPQFLEHLLINGELDVAWAGTIRMKVKAMTNTATTLVTGRGRGRIKSCSIQIGSVVCWPAVKVVTITSSKLSAKASSAQAAAPSRVAAG